MILIIALAIAVLGVAFYLTFLFSWCAGYDAAVRGSVRGSTLWRQVRFDVLGSEPKHTRAVAAPIASAAEMRRAVDAFTSLMWNDNAATQDEPTSAVAAEKIAR